MGPLVLLMFAVLTGSTGVTARFGPDGSVCDMKEYNQTARERPGQPKPHLPAQWSVRIEVDMYELGYSLDVHEFYDETNNRGAVVQWKHGVKIHYIYLYSTREILLLQYDETGSPPSCEVKPLQTNTVQDYFGLTNLSNGSELVYTPGAALHFLGAGTEVPMGNVFTKTGVPALSWESCTYIEALDGTFVVDWLFSTNTGWASPYNFSVPLERTASGTQHLNGSVKQIDRKYTYTDFRLLTDFDIFQAPPGTYCPNRVSTRQLPDIPNVFSFSSEVVDTNLGTVSWMKEYYDYDLKLVRWDAIPDSTSNSQFGNNLLTYVADFDSGATYVLDRVFGNCTFLPVSASGAGYKQQGGGYIMATKQEFLYLDKGNYQYTGQRNVREIKTDVYVAVRDLSKPSAPIVNGTIEWYFASDSWTSGGMNTSRYKIPVRNVASAPQNQMHTIQNIYDFSSRDPHIWKTDLSSCFTSNQQHHFRLTFPATHVNDVIADIDGFKSAFIRTIVAVTSVSPIRVNRIEVEMPVDAVVVTGTLLGLPPLPSSGTGNTFISLQKAVSSLSTAVTQHGFTVVMPQGGPTITATKIE